MGIDDYGTIKQAREKLGISRGLLYILEEKKVLNFYRLGGRVFIKWSEVERALQSSCKGCS